MTKIVRVIRQKDEYRQIMKLLDKNTMTNMRQDSDRDKTSEEEQKEQENEG